jgi:hypothetical protein
MTVLTYDVKSQVSIAATDQSWTDEDVKELRERYNIFYNRKTHIGILVVNDQIYIMTEDDGYLSWYKDYCSMFYIEQIDNVSNALIEVKNYLKEMRK